MSEKTVLAPRATMYMDEEKETYVVDFELPGVKKEDIQLTINSDIIHIHAEKTDMAYHGHVHFPLKVKHDESEASFDNGLLKLTVPLKEKPEPLRKVDIS